LAKNDDEKIRHDAVKSLCAAAAQGDMEASKALEQLSSSNDEHIRRVVAGVLGHGQIGARLADTRLKATNNSSGTARDAAIVQLQHLSHNNEESIRRNAAKALVDLSADKGDAPVALLQPLVQHCDEDIRRTAAEKLCSVALVQPEIAVDALGPVAQHNDEHIRRAAAQTLCSIAATGNELAVSMLEPLSSHEDEQIRRLASTALCSALPLQLRKGQKRTFDEFAVVD